VQEELLDIVDSEGTVIGSLPRDRIHGNPSLIHRVVHLLVFTEDNRLLLQKRSMDKDVAPGRWDTSVGGHVNAGESIEKALLREMEEELGITSCSPEFLYTYIHSNPYETELVYTYSCTYDGEVSFQQDEIDEVRPWSPAEISENLGKGVLSDNFEHEFRMYLKFINKP
jgi:isopentenyldiphosphate isomerase